MIGVWVTGTTTGFVNGDAAVYAWQGRHGILDQRVVHVGYLALASAVQGQGLGWLSLGSVSLSVVLVGGRVGWPAGLAVAAALLPVACFAEVDPVWMALAIAALVSKRWVTSLLAMMAVSVSPVAGLALVCVAPVRQLRWVAGGGLAALALLSVVLGPEYWLGDRGVFSGVSSPDPLRFVLTIPWLVVFACDKWPDPRWLLLLFVPTDVGVGLFLAAGLATSGVGSKWSWLWLAVPMSLWSLAGERDRIAVEQRLLHELVAQEPELVHAPWSLGVRYSLLVSDDPYGVLWLAMPPVRDQWERYCAQGTDPVHTFRNGRFLPLKGPTCP